MGLLGCHLMSPVLFWQHFYKEIKFVFSCKVRNVKVLWQSQLLAASSRTGLPPWPPKGEVSDNGASPQHQLGRKFLFKNVKVKENLQPNATSVRQPDINKWIWVILCREDWTPVLTINPIIYCLLHLSIMSSCTTFPSLIHSYSIHDRFTLNDLYGISLTDAAKHIL